MAIDRPPIQPLVRAFAQQYHTAAQLDRIKQATLDILETVGVRVESERALALLEAAGASVDRETQIAKLPPDLVLREHAKAPRYFTLGARDESCELAIADDTTYCTTDGCGVKVVDWDSGELRVSTKADLARITRMQDYLSSISFWWPTVSAGDHGETAQLHEIEAGWNNTVKHLQGMVNGSRHAKYAVEMAKVVAGGGDELRRLPVLSNLIGTVSPLVLDHDGIEAAMVFAEAGVPVTFVTMPTLGTTAPATRAGAFALGSAELVAATVVLQLVAPGAPVAHSIMQSYADLRSGGFVSFPLDGRGRALAPELAHHWGVPSEAACCGTDAKRSGTWQSAVEDGMDLAQFAWEGSDLAPSIGLLDVYTVFAPEELILGDDIYQRARYAIMDLDIDDESLALDTIVKVGPGGHYLGQKHTRTHLRHTFVPAITHQTGPDGGFRDPVEVAREKAKWIDENYTPAPLDPGKAAELAKLLAAADAELRR